MGYFEELPNISYPSLLPQSNKIEDRIEVKNIFRRSKLRSDVDQALTAFNYYYIKDDMRPDMVAQELYDDSELDWIVLTVNNIINIRDQWPLSHNDLYAYMLDKYGSEEGMTNIHHYETRQILDEYNRVVIPAGLEVDKNFSFEYSRIFIDGSGESKLDPKAITSSLVVAEVTNYDYENKLNEEKRRIKILKPGYLSAFISDHREIMSYGRTSEYISKKLKGTYNPRVSGV